MKKAPCYKGGGRIKGEPDKPVKSTIDRSKYSSQLSKPIVGEGTNFVGDDLASFSPAVLGANGYKYHSGTMGGKDIVYEKNGNLHLFNEQPNATSNKYGLINIGNGMDVPAETTAPLLQSMATNTKPIVDPTRKPLDLSNPNLTFDPNSNTYTSTSTGAKIAPIVENYNKGGRIRKAPVKGYANAGLVTNEFNQNQTQPQFVVPQQTNTTLAQGQSITPTGQSPATSFSGKTNNYSDAVTLANQKNTRAKTANASKLAGGIAMGIGNQMYEAPQDITTSDKDKAVNQTANDTIDNTAAAATPWYGIAKGVSDIGRSRLKKDKYDNVVGGTNQALDEWFTPSHQSYIDAYQREGVGGVAKDFLLGGQSTRAIADVTGHGNDTTGFFGKLNKFNGNTAIKRKTADNISALDAAAVYDENERERVRLKDLNEGNVNSAVIKRNDMLTGNMGFANGGKVVGAGTGKSDSISAKIRPGSFVIPAENAPIVEEIREKVLKKAPNKKANLNQGGGIPVNLSNGEVVLSPSDKSEMEVHGYNVEGFAPNADNGAEFMAEGGLTMDKAKTMLRDNQANGKPLSPAQKRYFGWVAGGSKKDGGEVDGYAKGGNVKDPPTNKQAANMLVDKRNKDIQKRNELLITQAKLQKALSDPNSKDKYYNEAALKGVTNTINRYNEMYGPPSETNGNNRFSGIGSQENISTRPTKKEPSKGYTSTQSSVTADQLDTLPVSSIPYPARLESLYGDRTPAEIARMNQTPVLSADVKTNDVVSTGNVVAPPNVTPTENVNNKANKFDYSNILGNAINYGVPLAQTAIGLRQLKKAGNRPVDALSTDYTNSLNDIKGGVTQAKDQSMYGFTGNELTQLNNQNTNLTNAGRYAARSFSGGSAANALNMERSVIDDSFGRSLNTQINDNQLKLQKQQEAFNRQQLLNSAIQDKQDRLRQYFNDDLGAWHQKTQSASSLTNMGLSNALDSYRADQRLKNFNNQSAQTNNFNTLI